MLYIEKKTPSSSIMENEIKITKTSEWKAADGDDTELIRSFFDQLDKSLIRADLIKEQHGICAYCMKRIKSDESMTIEHYQPVKGHKDTVLNYKNMLGCCKGGSGEMSDKSRVLCCDASKGDQEITIDPRNREMMDRIRYNKNGRIYVDPVDVILQNDIDNVLCLNGKLDKNGKRISDTSTHIVEGRIDAYRKYEATMKLIDRKCDRNEEKIKRMVSKRIKDIEEKTEYPEYAGVELFLLKRRLHSK